MQSLLQGASTQALLEFLKKEATTLKTDCSEPVDHIGLMLYQAAFFAHENRTNALMEHLHDHLYTWLPLYYEQHEKTNASAFYKALTKLTCLIVESLLE